MATEARWLVSMAESDKAAVQAWAERCERLGVSAGTVPALRWAVKLAESLADDDVIRGYA